MSYTQANFALYETSYRTIAVPDTAVHPVPLGNYTTVISPLNIGVTNVPIGGGGGNQLICENISDAHLNVMINMTMTVNPINDGAQNASLGILQNDNILTNTGGLTTQTLDNTAAKGTSLTFSTFLSLAPNDTVSPIYKWDNGSGIFAVQVMGFNFSISSY